jgi:hypothetical protein
MRARLAVLAMFGAAALAVVFLTAPSGQTAAAEDYGAAAAGCDVTETQVADVPRTPYGPTPGWVVGDGLWLTFGPPSAIVLGSRDGRQGSPNAYPGSIGRDGSIRVKWLWRRAKKGSGRLWVLGRDQSGRRFRVDTGDQYQQRKFVPSGVRFPGAGCWRVTAKSGKARIRFVVWVAAS